MVERIKTHVPKKLTCRSQTVRCRHMAWHAFTKGSIVVIFVVVVLVFLVVARIT